MSDYNVLILSARPSENAFDVVTSFEKALVSFSAPQTVVDREVTSATREYFEKDPPLDDRELDILASKIKQEVEDLEAGMEDKVNDLLRHMVDDNDIIVDDLDPMNWLEVSIDVNHSDLHEDLQDNMVETELRYEMLFKMSGVMAYDVYDDDTGEQLGRIILTLLEK